MSILRKSCPCCRQPWPDGKDPAELADNLMQMRLVDFLVGLKDNGAVLSVYYQNPVNVDSLPMIVSRACALQDAEALLEEALRNIQNAKEDFAGCPAVTSLPDYLKSDGVPDDSNGLDGRKVDYGGMRVTWDGESLRFMGTAERAREDGKWAASLL